MYTTVQPDWASEGVGKKLLTLKRYTVILFYIKIMSSISNPWDMCLVILLIQIFQDFKVDSDT